MRRRGKEQPNSGQGQDYLGSVSDLMSGLIFIFIITVAVFALRLAETRQSLAETREELTNSDEVKKQVIESIRSELEKEGIEVEVDPEQGVLRLTDRAILFERGAADPDSKYHANVGIVANVLLRVLRCHVHEVGRIAALALPPQHPSYCKARDQVADSYVCPQERAGAKVNTVLVEGHTDSVPIKGSRRFKDNLDLSAARSAEVLRMMHQCEPELSGLTNRSNAPVISVSGYGETRPIDRQHPDADENRRIDLRFLMAPPEESTPSPEIEVAAPAPVEETRRELAR